jgi:hypothetical protein
MFQFRLEILILRLVLCDMKDNILVNFMKRFDFCINFLLTYVVVVFYISLYNKKNNMFYVIYALHVVLTKLSHYETLYLLLYNYCTSLSAIWCVMEHWKAILTRAVVNISCISWRVNFNIAYWNEVRIYTI